MNGSRQKQQKETRLHDQDNNFVVVNMVKPMIGLSMLYCLREPFTCLLKRLHEVDVKHVELTDEGLHTLNKRRVKNLKEAAQSHDLDLVVHAPWAGINIAVPSPVLR